VKDYIKTYCIEGEYFTCPETLPPMVEGIEEEPSKPIPQKLPLSTDQYSKSIVRKRILVIYEKNK
jgi:hypothetical protein